MFRNSFFFPDKDRPGPTPSCPHFSPPSPSALCPVQMDRNHYHRLLDEERTATLTEREALRQEMAEAEAAREKRAGVERQRTADEGYRKGQEAGIEEGQRIAKLALEATIDSVNSKLEVATGSGQCWGGGGVRMAVRSGGGGVPSVAIRGKRQPNCIV